MLSTENRTLHKHRNRFNKTSFTRPKCVRSLFECSIQTECVVLPSVHQVQPEQAIQLRAVRRESTAARREWTQEREWAAEEPPQLNQVKREWKRAREWRAVKEPIQHTKHLCGVLLQHRCMAMAKCSFGACAIRWYRMWFNSLSAVDLICHSMERLWRVAICTFFESPVRLLLRPHA